MRKLFVITALTFFLGHDYHGQTDLLNPNLGSTGVFLNPAFVGTSRCARTGAVASVADANKYFLGQEADLHIDKLNGGLGLALTQSRNSSSYRSLGTSLMYSYASVLNRRLSLRLGTKLSADYRYFDFSSEGLPAFKGTAVFSAGAGMLLYSKNMMLAFAADQLNSPKEGSGSGAGFKIPMRYTAQAGYNFRMAACGITPSFIYEYQDKRLFVDSLQRSFVNQLNYGAAFIKFNNNYFSAGVGYRYHFNAAPAYIFQTGFKTRKLSLVYNLAATPQTGESQNSFAYTHQLSAEYILNCRPAKRKFVAYRSFDGAGGYYVSSFYRSPYPGFFGGSRKKINSISGWSGSNSSSHSSTSASGRQYRMMADQPKVKAGTLTAGEVNDFSKWKLWEDMGRNELTSNAATWAVYPNERFSVIVYNEDKTPVIGADVSLISDKREILWEGKTDAGGRAELWNNMFGGNQKATMITAKYKGKEYPVSEIKKFSEGMNRIEVSEHCELPDGLDVMFVVDGTSSMDDEIRYLRVEMNDILSKVKSGLPELKMRTASLFYMCPGNSYVTKHSPFTDQPKETTKFIRSQSAGGGGTEAVETALDEAVNQFEWNPNARARIIFLVLDEPPGEEFDIVQKMHKALADAARKGIKIIPVGASGIDKSTEYLMRATALATNGTYVFLTDHSHVGNSHIEPTTDEYDVTYLNQLLVNLVKKYSRASCGPAFEKSDLPKSDTGSVDIIDHVIVHSQQQAPKNLVMLPEFQEKSIVDTIIPGAPDFVRVYEQVRKIKFFPNPCQGSLNIETEENISEIFLADGNNKLLEKFELKQGKLQVDLSNYPNGIYFLQYFREEKPFTGKLIISH